MSALGAGERKFLNGGFYPHGCGFNGLSSEELSRRNRKRIARTGMIGRNPIWTRKEVEILRKHYPNLSLLVKQLPGRTREAIKTKARKSGLARKHHVWTTTEISQLRKLFPKLPKEELLAMFPYCSWESLYKAANYYKIYRPRFKLQWGKIGNPVIDDIRDRACDFRYSQGEVLDFADLPRHRAEIFKKRGTKRGVAKLWEVEAVVRALGGRIVIEWID